MTDAASALARTDQLEQLLSATTSAFLPGSGGAGGGAGGSAGTVPSVTVGAPSFASVLAATPAPATTSAAETTYPQYAPSPATAAAAPATTTAYYSPPATGTAASAPAAVPATGDGAGYLPLIQQAAARYGIDPGLLYGVIRQESAFDPNAVSSAGAEGLAQIMPENFGSLGITNPFDPVQSVDGGAQMLAENLQTFGGNESDALAAYNAGVGAVQRYGGVPPYAETQNYVQQVLGYAAQYPGAGGASASSPAAAGVATPAAAIAPSLLPSLPALSAASPLPALSAAAPYPTVGSTPTDPGAALVSALPDSSVEDTT